MLSDNIKARAEKIRHQFPTNQALVLPMLHFLQEETGWVSPEGQQGIADFLQLPVSKVKEVVTFYTMYQQKPVGKVNLQLCVNLSCWLNGSDKLLSCLEKRLGVGVGETTSDGRYTLTEVECLAACGTAPVLQVNEDYYEKLDVPQLVALLDGCDRQLAAGEQVGYSTRGMNHV